MAKIEKISQTTIKLIVWSQPSSKGHQLKIRITKNRKPNYINLGYFLSKSEIRTFFPSDTLRKSYPKYKEVMKLYDEELLKLNFNKEKPEEFDADDILSFSKFLADYLQLLEDRGQFGLRQKTHSVKYHLEKFTNKADIKFSDIDSNFLERLQTYFIQANVSAITQKGYFDKLKSLLNRAIEKDVHYFKKFPFIGFKPLSFETVRKNLTALEFSTIESIEKDVDDVARITKDSASFLKIDEIISEQMFQTVLKFKFQYYALGMRVSDLCVIRWSNVVSNVSRINYKMRKTGHELNFKISAKMYKVLFHLLPDEYRIPIIERIKNTSSKLKESTKLLFVREALLKLTASDKADDFIFNMIPFFEVKEYYSINEKKKQHKSIEVGRHKYNLQLNKLQKLLKIKTKLSSHVVRHTFALNALINKKLDIYEISKALNHQSVKTTEKYLNGFKTNQLDKGLKKLFDGDYEKIPDIMKKLTNTEKDMLLKMLQMDKK
jgi:integrase